jgi:hypothetical protein
MLLFGSRYLLGQAGKRQGRRERQMKLSDSERREQWNAKRKDGEELNNEALRGLRSDVGPISRHDLWTDTNLSAQARLVNRSARSHGGDGEAAPRRTSSGGGGR